MSVERPTPVDTSEWVTLLDELSGTRAGLMARPVLGIAEALGRAGEAFAGPGGSRFAEAVDTVREEAGYSPAMARRVVEGMARDWTRERLRALVQAEFPEPAVLDGFAQVGGSVRGSAELPETRRLRAVGDDVAVHIGAGSVPGVSTTSLIRSLLVKTPVLVKPGSGDRSLTVLFHEELASVDRDLSGSAAVRYWSGGSPSVEDRVFARAMRVVFYGSDAAARGLRARVPVHVPLVLYHHRSSVVVVGPDAFGGGEIDRVAAALAEAVCTFDQRGCVSPHRVWLLGGGDLADRLGEAVAAAMAREAESVPAGEVTDAERARIQQLRARTEMIRASGGQSRIWTGAGTTWTVVVQEPGEAESSGGPRTVQIMAVEGTGRLAEVLGPDVGHLQSAGVAGLGPLAPDVADVLVRAGVTRICPLGEMSFPPSWWLHDGAGPLRALVRWCEWVPERT